MSKLTVLENLIGNEYLDDNAEVEFNTNLKGQPHNFADPDLTNDDN